MIKKRRAILGRFPLLVIFAVGCFMVLLSVFFGGSWIFANLEADQQTSNDVGPVEKSIVKLAKADLPSLLNGLNLEVSPSTGNYMFSKGEIGLIAETSLDTDLQNYIISFLKRSMTYQAAVVALRPDNGQILAMVSSSKNGEKEGEDLCINADLPAASLFKIVSAAAAIEARNFTPDRILYYRGGKYTLYKRQLRQDKGRYLTKTSFREAFAGSINPVFGKIGIYDLGRDLIAQYADKFFFNREIPFDLSLAMSSLKVTEDDFELAEIASGFNKRTLLSPLHAVMITSAIANDGIMMEPWIVRNIKDRSGRNLYRAQPSKLASPIKSETARQLKILMGDTVVKGTCRKAFMPLRRKKVFKNIELGAKTGTINDYHDEYKYDWLTAFALPEKGDQGIGIAVLAVHGEKLGIRAKDIARYIINYHFNS
ncbi:penicillin-binding transpeptidase domain-containing protein [Thermodesulfobacteriota bacterium]